jgi:hypothetical protein
MSDIFDSNSLWNIIMDYGKIIRSNKMHGLENWNVIKNILKNIDDTIIWKSDIMPMYDIMIDKFSLSDDISDIKIEDEDERKRVWELMHFFLQHDRIQKNNKEKP